MKIKLSMFNCHVIATGDGDTFRCGGDVRPITPDVTCWEPKVRVAFVDADERGQPSYDEHRTLLADWLARGPFNLLCYGRDKYGRLLADAERGTGLLSAYLKANGVPAMGESGVRELMVDEA